jgi:hypothetical protein
MTFKPASRAGTKALIGLYGGSGSGKTYSALLLARGLVGESGKIMMIDTEHRRGEIYCDQIPGGYDTMQLVEPFSSQKYIEAIHEAEIAAGDQNAALIIDSMSHEWEGIGGVIHAAESIAEARAKKYGQWNGTVAFGDWKGPKTDHKRMVLKILGSNLHIICCLRAQFKSHQVDRQDFEQYGIDPKSTKGRTAVIRDNFQTPIQDSNFIYEMMVHAELTSAAPGLPRLTKCPEMLRSAFPTGKKISIETGKATASWLSGGAPDTKEMSEKAREAEDIASLGTEKYQSWFLAQTGAVKLYLVNSGKHEKMKKDALDADAAIEGDKNDE